MLLTSKPSTMQMSVVTSDIPIQAWTTITAAMEAEAVEVNPVKVNFYLAL